MIELLEKLINIPSVSGQEGEIARFLHNHLQTKGYAVKTQPISENRFNIFASNENHTPIVLLCTHIDTVPPFFPFEQKENLVYGRGACDAKGQIVSMLYAADMLKANDILNFGLLFVVDEENVSIGAKNAAKLSIGSKFVVVGEPTENKLAIGQKGVLVFRLKAVGTGGHSALPERGTSAIHILLDLLNQWLHTDWGHNPLLGQSLLNIGKISGGTATNILAHEAGADGIFRIATSLSEIHDKMNIPKDKKIDIEIPSESEPQQMVQIPGFETTVVSFGTDAAHLRPLGDIVLYGPGSIDNAHSDHENISLPDINQAVQDYIKIVNYLLFLNFKNGKTTFKKKGSRNTRKDAEKRNS